MGEKEKERLEQCNHDFSENKTSLPQSSGPKEEQVLRTTSANICKQKNSRVRATPLQIFEHFRT